MADKAKLLKAAQKHLTKGNLDKAIKVFQQLIEVDPRDHRLVLRLADLQARAGRKKEAIVNYEKVAAKYIKDDFTPKAIAVYKTVLRLDPELLTAYEKLSELYKSQGLEAEAISQLDNLFKLYEKKNDEEKQIEVLKIMSDMDSENLGVQVRLGETLAKKGRKQEAAEAFARAASTLSKRGLHDRASSLFEKITALNPGNIAVRKELCAHYLESGQYPEARKEIEAILEIEPDDSRMELLLGRILFQLGHKGEGEKHVGRSLELFKQSGELDGVLKEYLFVAQTHLRNDEISEAEAFYRKIDEATGGSPKAVKGLVTIAEKRSDRVGQIDSLCRLGGLLAASDDQEGAAEAYNRVLKLDPLNDEARGYVQSAAVPTQELTEAEVQPTELDAEEVLEIGDAELLEPMEAEEADLEADIEDVEILDEVELAQDSPGAGEEEAEFLEIPEEAMQEVADEIPDIVLDGFDDDVEVMEPAQEAAKELELEEATEEIVPVEEVRPAEGEMSLDEMLVEAEVYQRYNLADKVGEILSRAAQQYPGEIRVLERLADHQIQTSDPGAADSARKLVETLAAAGDDNAAQEAVARITEALPDPTLKADLEALLAVEEPLQPGEPGELDEAVVDLSEALEEEEVTFEEVAEAVPGIESVEEVTFEPVAETTLAGAPAETDRFADEMEEADFYLSQGLTDEARGIYESIIAASPGHEGATAALAGLDAGSEPAAAAGVAEEAVQSGDARGFKSKLIVEDAAPEDAGGFLDLADELRSELAEEIEASTPEHPEEGPVTFEEVFAEFKKGIAETLGDEEYETHYNLGIAYKDMGLYDDAIREFEVVTRDPSLAQDSLSLMAMCFMEKKDYQSAVKALSRALDVTGEGDRTGLAFQLAGAYEKMGELQSSLTHYREVKAADSAFEGIDESIGRVESAMEGTGGQEVDLPAAEGDMDDMLSDLIKEVEAMASESDGEDREDEPPPPKKNRISYL